MDVGDVVKKESMKILIPSSERFDAVVGEKGVKMAVVSSLGDLETLGLLKGSLGGADFGGKRGP